MKPKDSLSKNDIGEIFIRKPESIFREWLKKEMMVRRRR